MDKIERLIRMLYGFFKQKQTKADDLSCPDEETIACFLEGKLSSDEDKILQGHILKCRRCSELLNLFLEKEESLEVPDYLLDRVKKLIFKEEDLLPTWLEALIRLKERGLEILKTGADILLGNEILPLAVLRSRQIEELPQSLSLIKDFKELRVALEIKKTQEQTVDIGVEILRKDNLKPLEDIRIGLFREDKELESYVCEEGRVVFQAVGIGNYLLKITQDLKDIGLIKLELV